jgi:CubicO group peptidase (beta-lactamase class C family)
LSARAARVAALLILGIAAGLAFSGEPRASEALAQTVPASSASGLGDTRGVEEFFDELIPKQLHEGDVAGAAVAVVEDGRLVFAEGYGYADLEEREPVVAVETLFYPGSAGKLFTWTAVMQLAEEGKLDLEADVGEYLDFEIPDTFPEPITMSDLMTHTAGFEEEFAAQLARERQDVLPLREFLIRHMPERVYPPGETYAYSNYGTALAGYVVERVSGEPYERYVEEHILKPLGMKHSSATQPLPPGLTRNLSNGYHYRDGAYDAKGFEWVSNAPSAPVHSTAADMAKFMLAHLKNGAYDGGRILAESTAVEMHRRQFTHDPSLPGTAYGFVNSRANGRRVLLHDGESARFSTLVALLPDEGVGLFVSYNTPHEPFETLSAFMDRFYPAREEKSSPTGTLEAPASGLDRWAGAYVPARAARTSPQKIVGWLDPLTVSTNDGELLVASPFGEQRYVQTGPATFEEAGGEWSLVFREQDDETRLFLGPFPLAYSRVPAYQTLGFQLPLIAACLALFVSTLVVFPAASIVRRRRGAPPPHRAARLARWVAGITGTLNLALLVWFVSSLLYFAESYVWPTETVSTITRLWLLGVPLTLGVAVLSILAWKDRYWGAAGRVHYTLVAVAAVTFVLLLGNWNLIGP